MKAVTAFLCFLFSLAGSPPASTERVHCNLHALTPADRARDQELVQVLSAAVRERRELPDGYAYRLEPGVLKETGEWLAIVAKCCQPLTFEASLEPQPGGALWVRITGHDAKGFIEIEFAALAQKLASHGAR